MKNLSCSSLRKRALVNSVSVSLRAASAASEDHGMIHEPVLNRVACGRYGPIIALQVSSGMRVKWSRASVTATGKAGRWWEGGGKGVD